MAVKRLTNGKYEVRMRADGKSVRRYFEDRWQANTFEKLVKADGYGIEDATLIARGYDVTRKESQRSNICYQQFVEDVWIPRLQTGIASTGRRKRGQSASTCYSVLKRLRIIFPFVGHMRLVQLHRSHYDDVLELLLTQKLNRFKAEPTVYAPSTADKVLQHMRSSLSYAEKIGLLNSNPWADGNAIHVPETLKDHYKIDECKKLFATVKESNLRDFVFLFSTTIYGLRRSESFGIEKGDVDFDSDIILLRRQWDEYLSRTTGRPEFKEALKNGSAYKVLPIAEELRPWLKQICDATIGEQTKLFQFSLDQMKVTRKIIEPYAQKAGLPSISLHRLRDSMISNLSRAGTSEALIAKLAGCSKSNLKNYQRFNVTDLREIVNSFDFGVSG